MMAHSCRLRFELLYFGCGPPYYSCGGNGEIIIDIPGRFEVLVGGQRRTGESKLIYG